MNAMILAAGLGTRLKPFTDKHPKALAPVGDTTLLELNIKKLLKYNISNIVVNVHHYADQITAYLNAHHNFGAQIQISDETDCVLETGGGLVKAVPLFGNASDVLVCNVDILSDIDFDALIQYHAQQKAAATLAIQKRSTSRYLLFDDAKQLVGWQNTATGAIRPESLTGAEKYQSWAFSGIQIINEALFRTITLEGKFSLIDVYLQELAQNKIVGYDHTGGILLDVGKPESLEAASRLPNSVLL